MSSVYKFGGALLKDAEGMQRLQEILQTLNDKPLVVVVSALGKTTNALEEILQSTKNHQTAEALRLLHHLHDAHLQLIKELLVDEVLNTTRWALNRYVEHLRSILQNPFEDTYKMYDTVVGFGEDFSNLMVGSYLKQQGLNVNRLDVRKIIVTNSNFTDANIDWPMTQKTVDARLKPMLRRGDLVLTQGFVGADLQGNSTTIGREGSDFTAAILAKCLGADQVTVWKDVSGFMNADPNRFEEAVQLEKVSYREAIELAYYGASVVHPKTIQPLQKADIPLYVRNFYDLNQTPTLISKDTSDDEKMHRIIVKDKQFLLSIRSRNLAFVAEENLKDIFEVFSHHKIHINLMQNSAVSFSVCFDENREKEKKLLQALGKQFVLKYNTGLQLYTLRNAGRQLFEQLTAGKTVLLKQESRKTIRFLIRESSLSL